MLNLASFTTRTLSHDISHKVFLRSFRRSQLPHKSVNLFFTITNVKYKLTDLCGNSLGAEALSEQDPARGHHSFIRLFIHACTHSLHSKDLHRKFLAGGVQGHPEANPLHPEAGWAGNIPEAGPRHSPTVGF